MNVFEKAIRDGKDLQDKFPVGSYVPRIENGKIKFRPMVRFSVKHVKPHIFINDGTN